MDCLFLLIWALPIPLASGASPRLLAALVSWSLIKTLHTSSSHTSHTAPASYSSSGSRGLNHDYVFVTPVEVSSDGGYLSHDVSGRRHRTQRSLSSSVHYRLSAFGRDMQLDLHPSSVVGPGFTVQSLGSEGITTVTDDAGFHSCLYQGFIRNLSSSSAALSTCSGLAGLIRMSQEEYLIAPLPQHLAEEHSYRAPDGHHPHVIYKRSAEHVVHRRPSGASSSRPVNPYLQQHRHHQQLHQHQQQQHRHDYQHAKTQKQHFCGRRKQYAPKPPTEDRFVMPDEFATPEAQEPGRAKRSSIDSNTVGGLNVETLVVADRKMLEKHGRDNVTTNHCAYVVQRNVTCIMQDGVSTYVKAEYTTKCIWGQKCPVVMYRTIYKPKYKVGYKTVTELEWRCCPGYSGENCYDGPTSLPDVVRPPFKGLPHRPGVKGYPFGPRPPIDHVPGGGQLEPGRPYPGVPDHRPVPSGQLPGVTGERLDRMEEDLRRLTKGLDTLNGVVVNLEERLRTSLREDTKKILVSLLPNPPRLPDTTVEFGTVPDGIPDGLEGGEGFPGFGDLEGRVTEVRDELRAKTLILEEIQGMVLGHDGQLKKILEGVRGRPIPGSGSITPLDKILDIKLAGVRAEILDGFERRLTNLENHCDTKIGEVQQQCHQDHLDGQEQMQQSLDGRETGIREELGTLQAQIQGLTLTESCCGQVSSLSHRVLLLEESVKGLTESQRQLQNALTDQSVHVETLIESRLVDLESRLNASDVGVVGGTGLPDGLDGFKNMLEDKLKTLEERVFVAVEELSNATAPALLEGQVVPALETEIESLRRRVEGDLDGIQNQLIDLELLCTSSCTPSTPPAGGISITTVEEECDGMEKKMNDRLNTHSNQLERLNNTLQNLLFHIAQVGNEDNVHGEITLLKVNINSVNRTLKGLKDSITFLAHEVGRTNDTWEHREHQLVNQVHGISRLVGHQATLLGAGERRLAQIKGELVALKRRLSGELQGCRSTAIEVQKEVKDVDSRVSKVEGQCGTLGELAEHLERIRAELERHSDSYLAKVNTTLAVHSEQLAELKGEVKNCNHQGDQ